MIFLLKTKIEIFSFWKANLIFSKSINICLPGCPAMVLQYLIDGLEVVSDQYTSAHKIWECDLKNIHIIIWLWWTHFEIREATQHTSFWCSRIQHRPSCQCNSEKPNFVFARFAPTMSSAVLNMILNWMVFVFLFKWRTFESTNRDSELYMCSSGSPYTDHISHA